MSDLTGTSGIGRSGNGRAQASSGPVPVPQAPSSGVRTPRDIMNERKAREAAKEARRRAEQAEAEAEAEEQNRINEQRRKSAERRAAAAAAQKPQDASYRGGYPQQERDSGYRSAGKSLGASTPAETQYSTPSMLRGNAATGSAYGSSTIPLAATNASVPGVRSSAAGAPRLAQPSASYPTQTAQAAPSLPQTRNGASGGQPASADADPPIIGSTTAAQNTSSFPHAFERWETLSSHWEGLTSYWIRKLEQNTEAISRDITAAQMSRQITDLSAAGANLFHAVVELQRLRASSERKFQRWFFETRAQQGKDQEEKARLREELESEKQDKVDVLKGEAIAEFDKRQAQMKRELQISKDEARRAWDELGRKEQQERDQMFALREGHPIWVGGIQVQPMQAGMSRGPSLQRSTDQPQQYGPMPGQGTASGEREYTQYEPHESSPTDTDPFTERRPPQQGSARVAYPNVQPSVSAAFAAAGVATTTRYPVNPGVATSAGPATSQPSTASQFYRHQDQYLHDFPATTSAAPQQASQQMQSPTSDISGLDETPTAQSVPFDDHRISAATQDTRGSTFSDDAYSYESEAERERDQAIRVGNVPGRTVGSSIVATGASQTTGRAQPQQRPEQAVDYEGEGFGSGEGWDEIPRHHHPTRLSNVTEEEEEASRGSQGSRGVF